MCFSKEASFVGAAVLTIAGTLCIKETKYRSQLFLALIPFFFAIQQFAEGMIWLAATGDNLEWYVRVADKSKYWFLTIALVLWPVWIPLSLLSLERIPWRRSWFAAILGAGVVYSLTMLVHLYYIWTPSEISVDITEGSIQYGLHFPYRIFFVLFYLVTVLLPPLLSSYSVVWLFGLANVIALGIAYAYYEYAFTSVWCFFAAWISLGIYLVIKESDDRTKPNRK
jgi:hypothetical protein